MMAHNTTHTEGTVFKLTIHTDNDAFAEGELTIELARILRDLADRVEEGEVGRKSVTVYDINGNDVGRAKLTQED